MCSLEIRRGLGLEEKISQPATEGSEKTQTFMRELPFGDSLIARHCLIYFFVMCIEGNYYMKEFGLHYAYSLSFPCSTSQRTN
jgi:hypothetical protein